MLVRGTIPVWCSSTRRKTQLLLYSLLWPRLVQKAAQGKTAKRPVTELWVGVESKSDKSRRCGWFCSNGGEGCFNLYMFFMFTGGPRRRSSSWDSGISQLLRSNYYFVPWYLVINSWCDLIAMRCLLAACCSSYYRYSYFVHIHTYICITSSVMVFCCP